MRCKISQQKTYNSNTSPLERLVFFVRGGGFVPNNQNGKEVSKVEKLIERLKAFMEPEEIDEFLSMIVRLSYESED